MQLTLYKRSVLVRNILIFTTFSLLYFQVLDSLGKGIFALQWDSFIHLLVENKLLLTLFGLTIFSVFKAWKVSKYYLVLFVSYIAIEGIILFWGKFDKAILGLTFIYIVMAFVLSLFWWMELSESIYRPGFQLSHIGKKSEYDFPVKVTNQNGEFSKGYLTNWDEIGCFINFDSPSNNMTRDIVVEIEKFGRKFIHEGQVMTGYGDGIGIRFRDSNKSEADHNWFDFYKVINDRGYMPRGLRT